MTGTDRHDHEPRRLSLLAGADFRSILFAAGDADLASEEPPLFHDLNLDQVVEAIIAGREEYDLKPFFHTPLHDEDEVVYRQEVFRDLENDRVRAAVGAFAQEMQQARRYLTLAHKQRYKHEKERWFLDAATTYHEAVAALAKALRPLDLRSRGFARLRDHLAGYVDSEEFAALASDTTRVRDALDAVAYTMRIKGARVTVSPYQGEREYTLEVEETFARFREGGAESHLVKVPDPGSMDHVEARIAQLVARLNPDAFRALAEFCARHRGFLDPLIARFDREIQFFLAYLEHAERLERNGLSFCHPSVSTSSKNTLAEASFDIALATKLQGEPVVTNDFALAGPERILVVTGPNQGGKTTFARMFGQLHYLAALGVPVPGRTATLFLPDRLFTHFEKQEDIATLRGKLDDELVRMREILDAATSDSVVVINEIFASTTLADAVTLGQEILGQLLDLGCLAVCVTFLDELASLDEATVSMVATVKPDDPSQRTFKIVPKPADGRAYAWAIADKYGLSYERLRARIAR